MTDSHRTDSSSADEESTAGRDAAGLPKDDERESEQKIEHTGEPDRDALGNQDGAS